MRIAPRNSMDSALSVAISNGRSHSAMVKAYLAEDAWQSGKW
jgi:hypothetical protein